jgi:cyclophilin family peptidyl-prolyl cis-trans isomerase
MFKRLIALPFFGLVLVAASAQAQTPATPATPALGIVPPAEVVNDPSNRLTLELSNGGKVVILLRPDAAPAHIERLKTLVRRGFYNGLTFHRVVPGFMAQGGDPKGTGEGGSELPDLKAEFNKLPFLRGTVGAARSQSVDSANSQFFIMFAPNITLEGRYTVLGRVIEGMQTVDTIAPGEPPAQPTQIVRAYLGPTAPATAAQPTPAPAQETAPAEPPAAPTGG